MFENNQNPENTGYKDSFKLRFNYWLLENRDFFYKLAFIVFVVFDLFLVSLIVIFYVNYFLTAQKQNKIINHLVTSNQAFGNWVERQGPQELKISETTYVNSVNDRYDLVSQLENKNKNWFLKSLKYDFSWSGGKSEVKETFVLPGEKKYLLALNQASTSRPNQLKLEIISTEWEWVGDTFMADIMDKSKIEITKSEVLSGMDSILDRTSYSVKNNTIYNFWEVGFNIILYQGQKIVGLNRSFIEKFNTGEERQMENTWIQKLPQVTKIVVEPEINFLDKNNYIPTVGTGELK
ncbi:MAG: hypothetical protein WCX88_02135 [Patescibacteria group bacterium]